MAAICRAFRKSFSSTECNYDCVAQFPKNPTSNDPSQPSRRNPVRSAGKTPDLLDLILCEKILILEVQADFS